MKTIFINGKFFGQPTTGAQRFATELVLALDDLLFRRIETSSYKFVLVVPSDISSNIPILKVIHIKKLAGYASHQWEQFSLLWFVGNSLLINLSGSGPMLKRNQIFTIFDAAIFDFPSAYSSRFVGWYRTQFKIQSLFCRGLITISNFSRYRLSLHLNIHPSRFKIIPCGVDHIYNCLSDETILDRHGLSKNGYLLAVGSANPSKNFPALIEAFLQLREYQHIVLVVVGGKNSFVFADTLIAESDRIIRTGRVNDAQLKALYSNALAFVFPSLYEGFGIPPLEAMACGCPVIASNATSIPEICGNAARYFDPSSIVSIRNEIENIINNDDSRQPFQNLGWERVKEFTWIGAAEKLMTFLEEELSSVTYL